MRTPKQIYNASMMERAELSRMTAVQQQAEIRVVGIVQGIGFRPFIYCQATKRQLTGYVLNTGNSAVQIVVEGNKNEIIDFIEAIKIEKPHLAVIDDLTTTWHTATGQYQEFTIEISRTEKRPGGSIIPADIAICDECLQDITEKGTRHHRYPLTCCAICGPRYTTIINTPYDRERTTMEEFPLCEDCQREFTNPHYRRYNAQTICCPQCGPKFHLINQRGHAIDVDDVFSKTVSLLNQGSIIAIKGLGGIHLAVSASNESQIRRLRKLRRKPTKPLAIMSQDLNAIREYAILSPSEEKILTSWRRPIVVITKRDPFPLAQSLSPGLDNIGVMLPYSGIYQLLFEGLEDLALVMTSANPTGLPTIIRATTFQEQFMKMADYFLTHNRTIYQRCDDSVIIPFNDVGLIVRRSRGYTPEPIETASSGPTILAVGALEKNTGAIYNRNRIFLTQHIGDVDSLETLNFLQSSLDHLRKLLRVDKFKAVACDLHPDFLTTNYAETIATEQDISLVRVQHHHAHLAALLVDHQRPLEEKIVAICCDGAGYGADQTIWGGEILVGNASTYKRRAHLRPHPMPGGDLAARYPIRMLVGILSSHYTVDELYDQFKETAQNTLPQGAVELQISIKQATKGINSPLTSSTGRVLDAISTLLGVCHHRTYEGEPAIRLEAYAQRGNRNHAVNFTIPSTMENKCIILETGELVDQIYQQLHSYQRTDLALAAHISLGKALAETAITIARQEELNHIGFSGGVAYNRIITNTIRSIVKDNGFHFLMHNNVPPGDAGTAVGQAFVARAKYPV